MKPQYVNDFLVTDTLSLMCPHAECTGYMELSKSMNLCSNKSIVIIPVVCNKCNHAASVEISINVPKQFGKVEVIRD